MNARPAIVIEVTRGSMVESLHRVHAVIARASGEVVEAWGEADRIIYPRSAIKPFQALPLIESGAAEACHASDEEVALAAASHSGSVAHVMAVEAWLERLGLEPGDLGCGAHAPYDETATHSLVRQDLDPTPAHNNCSGKHTGFLATARHLGEPFAGYLEASHPVQRRLYGILEDLGGAALEGTGRGVDGCGIPIYGMPLSALARAAARFAEPASLNEPRRAAAERIVAAMIKHPYMVAGRGRFDTVAMKALRGDLASKGGAEGVQVMMLPQHGLGVALKCEDGAKRGGDTAAAHLLDHLGLVDDRVRRELDDFLVPKLRNVAGTDVGTLRPADGWLG